MQAKQGPKLQDSVHLSVSLVTFHSPLEQLQKTLECLRAGVESARRGGVPLQVELCIVDHTLEAGYRERLRGWLPGHWPSRTGSVELRFADANPGYGAGHNAAFSEVDSDYHLVLNPDVELDSDALQQGIGLLQSRDDVVLVAPTGRDADGFPQYLCKRYPSVAVLALRAFAPSFLRRWLGGILADYEYREHEGDSRPYPVTLVSGCCMLLRSAALRRAGGFDSRFFMYFEDFDLSLRLGEQGAVLCHPGMGVIHHGGDSANKGWRHIRMFARSGIAFFNRHGWKWI